MKLLLNHALPNDSVTAGYQLPGMDWLRAQAEKVVAHLLAQMQPKSVAS